MFSMDAYLTSPSSALSWYPSHQSQEQRESFPYSRVISPPMPMAGPSPCSRGLDGHYSPLQYPENHDEQLKANSNQAPGYCPSSASMKMSIARETRDFREEMRKKANNARERMRVKSMNIEFKKLEQLSRNHVSMEKQPTRLQILRSTKDTILALEAKLRVQFEMEKELRETSPTQKVRKHSTCSSTPSVVSFGTSPEENFNYSTYYDL